MEEIFYQELQQQDAIEAAVIQEMPQDNAEAIAKAVIEWQNRSKERWKKYDQQETQHRAGPIFIKALTGSELPHKYNINALYALLRICLNANVRAEMAKSLNGKPELINDILNKVDELWAGCNIHISGLIALGAIEIPKTPEQGTAPAVQEINPAYPIKTREEIDELKRQWNYDPCWDLEKTEDFENYHDELLAYSEARTKDNEARYQKESAELAKKMGIPGNFQLARYIEGLEFAIDKLQAAFEAHYDNHN